jgi:hypothetical protein
LFPAESELLVPTLAAQGWGTRTLANKVAQIQSCSDAVGGDQGAPLMIADAFISGFSNGQTAYALGTSDIETETGMTESGGKRGIGYFKI